MTAFGCCLLYLIFLGFCTSININVICNLFDSCHIGNPNFIYLPWKPSHYEFDIRGFTSKDVLQNISVLKRVETCVVSCPLRFRLWFNKKDKYHNELGACIMVYLCLCLYRIRYAWLENACSFYVFELVRVRFFCNITFFMAYLRWVRLNYLIIRTFLNSSNTLRNVLAH